MSQDEVRVGPFRDRVQDFEHLNKAVVWLQLGDTRWDDYVGRPVRIDITPQSDLFDEVCKLHAFRYWGLKVFARRRISTNQRGEQILGFCETVYERPWSEDWARQNFKNIQDLLFTNPSREACHIIMLQPRNPVDGTSALDRS
jgi:hypothetical protein